MKLAQLTSLLLIIVFICSNASAWMINEDYQQRDARDATDFDIYLEGDVRNRITGGGQSSVTNPFPDPTREITLTGIGNTKIKFKSSNNGTIPQDLNTNRHFGIYGTGTKPKVRFKAWSYATSPNFVPVPKSNFNYVYMPTTGELTITVENLTEDTVTFSDVGYLLSSVERPINDLTRDVLPPSAFTLMHALNAEYLPGQARETTLTDVAQDMYILTYATVTFTGGSADNPYNEFGTGTGGEWAQAAVTDQVAKPIPSLNQTGMIILVILLMLAAAALIAWRKKWSWAVILVIFAIFAFSATSGYAWKRGNHAARWTKGGTIKICIDTPPGDATQQAAYLEAVFEAMAEWNEAQAEFGGLTLEFATENCDARVKWEADRSAWGSTMPNPNGQGEIEVICESADGINSRGVARILKHEFGHLEGLGHSEASDLMKARAYGQNGDKPKVADLNSANAFTDPTDDDKKGKKELYGTVAEENKAEAESNAEKEEDLWKYNYTVRTLDDPGYFLPTTEFTISFQTGITFSDIYVTAFPTGWIYDFYDEPFGDEAGKSLDEEESISSPLLRFYTSDEMHGIQPGDTGFFQYTSEIPPIQTRAYSGAPAYNTDEFMVASPGEGGYIGRVPSIGTYGFIILSLVLLGTGLIFGWRKLRQPVK